MEADILSPPPVTVPSFTPSIALPPLDASDSNIEVPSTEGLGRDNSLRLDDPKHMPEGRLLFWSGVGILLLSTLVDTTVSSGEMRVQNMQKAASQQMLALIGVTSMISGAVFIARSTRLILIERVLLAIWLLLVTNILTMHFTG